MKTTPHLKSVTMNLYGETLTHFYGDPPSLGDCVVHNKQEYIVTDITRSEHPSGTCFTVALRERLGTV